MTAWRHWFVSLTIVILVSIWSLLPFYWLLVTSFKEAGTEFRLPIEYISSTITLENYRIVIDEPFTIQQSIGNSLLVSTAVMFGTILVSSLSAYAIARLHFRYKVQSLILLQIAGTVPPVVVIYPTFILTRSWGLLGTVYGLILPNIAYNIPLSVWLLTAYFSGLPYELEDAAMTDGFKPFSIYWRIMLPLATPALFSAGIIAFLGSWGEFILALTISLGRPEAQTVPAAVMSFSQQFELQWAWVAAGIVLSVLPVIALTLVFQRFVIRGLTSGAVKY